MATVSISSLVLQSSEATVTLRVLFFTDITLDFLRLRDLVVEFHLAILTLFQKAIRLLICHQKGVLVIVCDIWLVKMLMNVFVHIYLGLLLRLPNSWKVFGIKHTQILKNVFIITFV